LKTLPFEGGKPMNLGDDQLEPCCRHLRNGQRNHGQAELPGVDRKDIALQLENNVLTLKGDRRFEKETNQENYHRAISVGQSA